MIEMSDHPAWPTTLRSRLRDGRLMGTDDSVWLYRSVPMAPVRDARTPAAAIEAAGPLLAAMEELAALTPYTMKRRIAAKSGYHQVHLLLINVPQQFAPPHGHPNAEYLRQAHRAEVVDRRVLLMGVRLRAKVGGGGGLRGAIDSVAETLTAGGTPLRDYDEGFDRVSRAMDAAGLVEATDEEIRLANAWWNHGDYPDTPTLRHPDHIHVFNSAEAVRSAISVGVDSCKDWPDHGVPQHAISFASVQELDLGFMPVDAPAAAWVSGLVSTGALATSVRGYIEPGEITREELRRQRKKFIDDINERVNQNKMSRSEQDEMLARLESVEAMYSEDPPPTLTHASIVVGIDGQVGDLNQFVPRNSPVKLSAMLYRQPGAMSETMLCSNIRANPNVHDLPIQTIGCSGMPSLNIVGEPGGDILMGFTERDRQPAYLDTAAASDTDSAPIFVCPGQTGSGKTQLMLHMADQAARAGRPSIIFDPKQDSDHTAAVEASGGQVYSLDSLLKSDGVFDPITFAPSVEVGIEMAASVLMSINPWGTYKDDMEVPLQQALTVGVKEGGATSTLQALLYARQHLSDLPQGLVERVEQLADASPQFRAICGKNPAGESLSAARGITLIKVGGAHLDLPQPGQPPNSIQQRIALALVRMVVFGSAMAVAGKYGLVLLDEAWIVLGAGAAEVERLGRLARSQKVVPCLFTQRVTDAVNAGLTGYISRGFILPMEDPTEAQAACDLFKIEATSARMARLTAKATIGGNSANAKAPNWRSMRALRDPETGKVLRGSVGVYVDLIGNAIPVEVRLNEEFLLLSSTNPKDIERREQLRAERERAELRAKNADLAVETGVSLVDRVF